MVNFWKTSIRAASSPFWRMRRCEYFFSSTGYRPAKNGQHYVEGTLVPVVIPRSALQRLAMVQDLESGRWTEIDYLNGAIVKMGSEVGIDTPFHQSIVALIHAREQV